MKVYICTKFHENILNGIRVMERTRKVNGRTDGRPDRQTDGWTDGGHDIIRPVFNGRIKKTPKSLEHNIRYETEHSKMSCHTLPDSLNGRHTDSEIAAKSCPVICCPSVSCA